MRIKCHRRWFLLGALLVALVMIGGCSKSSGKSQRRHRPPPKVGVVTIQAQPVELFTVLPGRTSPYRVAEIRPQVNGIVIERQFNAGTRVKEGQTLYQIDPKPYKAKLAQAQAELAAAEAAVSSVAARAQRYAKLVEINAISQQEYADVKAKLARKRAQVKVAKAKVQAARIKLDYTTIESPITGYVSRSFITVGALVTAGQSKPLTQVTRLDPIYVDISRSAEQVRRLKRAFQQGELQKTGPGEAKVTLLLGNGHKYPYPGTIEFSDVTVEPDTASVTLRAKFPNPDHALLPGMFVRVRLSEGVKEHALLVPQQGVVHNSSGSAVALVVGEDNVLKKQVLELGRAVGTYWLVTDGLSVGDRVLVTGRQVARPGMKVRPEPAHIPNRLDEDAGSIAGPAKLIGQESSASATQADTEVDQGVSPDHG